VSLERVTWLVVVAVCLIAVALLAIGGYTGCSITVAAVGIAAAVNLLPFP
jgi:TRAP-type C4-dicarboxylate transport system permease small subunit